jgi:hypothetical protein
MLEWIEEYDRYDNTIYEAAGPYQEEDGTVFYYRIVPVLRDNKVQFSTWESDAELISASDAEEFPTVEAAKADCQQRDANLRAELANQ